MWGCDVKMWRWEDVKMWGCEGVRKWGCEDVRMRRCEDLRMWRCEDEKMWACEDVKMWGCEDEKMWRWEDFSWEDVKMWRWENVSHTPTIRRILRSDALGKIDDLGVLPFMETPTCLTCLLPQWIFIGPGCSGDICGGPQHSSQQKHPQLQIVVAMILHQAYELLDFICFFCFTWILPELYTVVSGKWFATGVYHRSQYIPVSLGT
jgi:hypothetical protein